LRPNNFPREFHLLHQSGTGRANENASERKLYPPEKDGLLKNCAIYHAFVTGGHDPNYASYDFPELFEYSILKT